MAALEKALPLTNQLPPPRPWTGGTKKYASRTLAYGIIIIVFTWISYKQAFNFPLHGPPKHEFQVTEDICRQPAPLFPSNNGNEKLDVMWDYINSAEFKKASVARLSGAVQIPTQSFDDLGPIGEDSRWDVMYPFADYLKKTFPRVHDKMQPEVVNTHGLLFTLTGSNEKLKPILLMAHQDVVPVPNETVSAWTHPPFSGYFDGKLIWGRGSSDCKNNLIAIMEVFEEFLLAGFKPKRTVILSFGFDEEISGSQGAGHLAPFLHERYGDNGIETIVDEGAGFEDAWGSVFTNPGTSEKGNTDVIITVRTAGGHSSIPTDHTSIGILSELITKIESDQYRTHLADNNPYLERLQCGAAHSPDFPEELKKLLGARASNDCKYSFTTGEDKLALEAARLGGPAVQYLMQTSQAVDVIQGGVKANALPERATVLVDHRINIGDKPEMVWERLTKLAKPLAEKYNLTLNAFNGVDEEPHSISLHPTKDTLSPAPVTPTDTDRVTPFYVLAGTTRAVYGTHIVTAPGIMSGNTDTRYYWALTKHIFRYGAGYDPEFDHGGLGNVHTVDENISIMSHIGMVKWFTMFVRNMDEADIED